MPVLKKLLPFAIAACLLLVVLGSKWSFVERHGTDMPDWDQWDAEAVHLLVPWFHNDDIWHEILLPQNEHRIVPSKIQNLTLTLIGGNWDARVQTVTNAILHSLLALTLFVIGRRWLTALDAGTHPRAHLLLRGLWFLAVAFCFGFPLAWQNVLGGFHSSQYWLILFSFVTVFVLPFSHPREWAWWLGAFAASILLVTMGAGFLAAAAAITVLGFRLLRRGTTWREAWPSLLIGIAVCVVGWFTRIEVPQHADLKARNVSDFLLYAVRSLQWPERMTPYAGLLLWAPWLAIIPCAWRAPRNRAPVTLAGLGGFIVLEILATAYARGRGADWPASRYMDTLLLGLAINALALLWLLAQVGPGARRWVAFVLGGLWIAALAHGMQTQSHLNEFGDLGNVEPRHRHAEENMRGFLATDDMMFLERPDIPYPNAGALRDRLNLAPIRQLMPVSMRPALPLRTAENAGFIAADSLHKPYTLPPAPRSGLSPDTASLPAYQVFGSYTAAGASATGIWRSAPLTATPGSWLKFETAGALGGKDDPKISLTLNDAKTGRVLAAVRPKHPPGDGWHAAYVRAPTVPFTVNATDASPEQWLAFTAPTEMTPLSHLAWVLSKSGHMLLICAASASAVLGLLALVFVRPQRV